MFLLRCGALEAPFRTSFKTVDNSSIACAAADETIVSTKCIKHTKRGHYVVQAITKKRALATG